MERKEAKDWNWVYRTCVGFLGDKGLREITQALVWGASRLGLSVFLSIVEPVSKVFLSEPHHTPITLLIPFLFSPKAKRGDLR